MLNQLRKEGGAHFDGRAVKELQQAAELEPGNASIALELSRLLQEHNRFADARTNKNLWTRQFARGKPRSRWLPAGKSLFL